MCAENQPWFCGNLHMFRRPMLILEYKLWNICTAWQFLFNYLRNHKTHRKCDENKLCVSVSYATSIPNTVHSNKYLRSYAWDTYHMQVFMKCQMYFILTSTGLCQQIWIAFSNIKFNEKLVWQFSTCTHARTHTHKVILQSLCRLNASKKL
jgi:hypothetical protein